jgi:hypothetical protein
MMTIPLIITYPARSSLQQRRRPEKTSDVSTGRVPRLARLLALAIKFDNLLRSGTIRNHADLARLGHVTRARISQIMNLLSLAPDIQEEILFLPLTKNGRDPINVHHVQSITLTSSWKKQRRLWRGLKHRAGLVRSP